MLNDGQNGNGNKYDLEERTSKYGEEVLVFCKKIKITIYTENILKQLFKSVTSIGANYMEANGASSRKDFCNKIYICKKESQETRYWLRMLKAIQPEMSREIDIFLQEAQELSMIFHKISTSARSN